MQVSLSAPHVLVAEELGAVSEAKDGADAEATEALEARGEGGAQTLILHGLQDVVRRLQEPLRLQAAVALLLCQGNA